MKEVLLARLHVQYMVQHCVTFNQQIVCQADVATPLQTSPTKVCHTSPNQPYQSVPHLSKPALPKCATPLQTSPTKVCHTSPNQPYQSVPHLSKPALPKCATPLQTSPTKVCHTSPNQPYQSVPHLSKPALPKCPVLLTAMIAPEKLL